MGFVTGVWCVWGDGRVQGGRKKHLFCLVKMDELRGTFSSPSAVAAASALDLFIGLSHHCYFSGFAFHSSSSFFSVLLLHLLFSSLLFSLHIFSFFSSSIYSIFRLSSFFSLSLLLPYPSFNFPFALTSAPSTGGGGACNGGHTVASIDPP